MKTKKIELSKDVLETKNIDGWKMYEDSMTGVFHWYNHDFKDVEIMATPNWADDGMTPFALVFNDDDGDMIVGDVRNDQYFEKLRSVISMIKKLSKHK